MSPAGLGAGRGPTLRGAEWECTGVPGRPAQLLFRGQGRGWGWGRAAAVSSLEQHFPTVWRSDTWLSHIPAPAGSAALGRQSRREGGKAGWEAGGRLLLL